ncbi:uncharacterized protein LOC129742121 [Uranotaenia lowii]|uniref:uncharacterized protein LOC129742121 n=1 Tax=Uranotaenia lowii TaxID=190385 RepID=UPI00247B1268|nr:uncharacterized protein LOC129742121 [Uranotaenia lowii]
MPRCAVLFCESEEGKTPGKSYFGFPQDENRCKLWVNACESEELNELFSTSGPKAFRYRKICSDHFADSSFQNPHSLLKRLIRAAVPLAPLEDDDVYLNYEFIEECNSLSNSEASNSEVLEKCISPPFPRASDDALSEPSEDENGSVKRYETLSGVNHHPLEIVDEKITASDAYSHRLPSDSVKQNNNSENHTFVNCITQHLELPELNLSIETNILVTPLDNYDDYCNYEFIDECSSPSHSETSNFEVLEKCTSSPIPRASDDAPLEPSEDVNGLETEYKKLSDVNHPLEIVDEEIRASDGNTDCWKLFEECNSHILPSNSYEQNTNSETDTFVKCINQHDELPEPNHSIESNNQVDEFGNVENDQISKNVHRAKIRCLKRQLFVAKQKNQRRNNIVVKLKKNNSWLKKEIRLLRKTKNNDEVLGIEARKNPVIFDSLVNSKKKPHARRYRPETVKFASGLYLSGPRAYRHIQRSKFLTLPCRNSVYNFNKSIRLRPGINYKILELIKQKTLKFNNDQDRLVLVTCDGMSIKPQITYNAKSDVFFGFPDTGRLRKNENNNHMKLASEAITVMISGLYRNYKQPIAFFLAHNSLGSQGQLILLKKCIQAVKRIGLIPVAMTMDQGSTNIKMLREAGVSKNKPWIVVDGEKVGIFYDAPHLIKSARNALKKTNAVSNGKIASFRHVELLYEVDIFYQPV